jgi:hypothetical protein
VLILAAAGQGRPGMPWLTNTSSVFFHLKNDVFSRTILVFGGIWWHLEGLRSSMIYLDGKKLDFPVCKVLNRGCVCFFNSVSSIFLECHIFQDFLSMQVFGM